MWLGNLLVPECVAKGSCFKWFSEWTVFAGRLWARPRVFALAFAGALLGIGDESVSLGACHVMSCHVMARFVVSCCCQESLTRVVQKSR